MCKFQIVARGRKAHPTTTARLIGRSLSSDMA
jgi:hypothetical protein